MRSATRRGLPWSARATTRARWRRSWRPGRRGYGLAQRKLGQIYDKGNSAVPRDCRLRLLWYQKARAQGVHIDKPVQRVLPKWSTD